MRRCICQQAHFPSPAFKCRLPHYIALSISYAHSKTPLNTASIQNENLSHETKNNDKDQKVTFNDDMPQTKRLD